MLNTYIKNRGLTQTLIHTNNRNQFNETNWDADYDGNVANISVTSNTDGNKKRYNVSLDNEDLANLLNVPSISMPIDKRLQFDFAQPEFKHDPRILQIELPDSKPEFINEADKLITDSMQKTNVLESAIPRNYLSSPLTNEELIVPITIDDKTIDNYTLTPRRRHRHKKMHKTYKVYKKQKSPKSKSKKSTRSKTKSRVKTTQKFSLF
jgi:hypothetical protein